MAQKQPDPDAGERNRKLHESIEAANAAFEKLSLIEQIQHLHEQKKSFIRGNVDMSCGDSHEVRKVSIPEINDVDVLLAEIDRLKKLLNKSILLDEEKSYTATNVAMNSTNCPYCSMTHPGICPRVKSIEYWADGTVRRVDFITPNNYKPVSDISLSSVLGSLTK